MKSQLIFIVALFGCVFTFWCCDSKLPLKEKPEILTGYVTAEKNGKPWNAHMYAIGSYICDTTWQLGIYQYDTTYWFLTESMEFIYLPKRVGAVPHFYELPDTVGPQIFNFKPMAGFLSNEDDVIFSALHALENDTFNQFNITQFDTLGGLIEGNFQMRFVARRKPGPSYPDTLVVIENGHFSGTYRR
jgi:hypothetical protein